jgi:hypothetical protein
VPITGITDLYGQRNAGYTGAGALETRQGLPGYGPAADPYGQGSHGQWGDLAGPSYAAPGWNAVLRREANEDVYTTDFLLTDDTDVEGLGAGDPSGEPDRTPYPVTVAADGYSGRGRRPASAGEEVAGGTAPAAGYSTHAGPYPRTWTQAGRMRPEPGTQLDDQWTEQEARRITHEGGYGAEVTGWTGPDEPEVHRRDVYYTSQGHPLRFDPGQLRLAPMGDSGPNAARGNRDAADGALDDEVQGGGSPNGYGYGDAHVQNYRQQTDGVPFNFNWLDASERPFIPKGQQTNMYTGQTLDGPDSPYGTAGDQTDYHDAVYGPAMVEGAATPYAAPPDPTLGQGYPDSGEDVFAYG